MHQLADADAALAPPRARLVAAHEARQITLRDRLRRVEVLRERRAREVEPRGFEQARKLRVADADAAVLCALVKRLEAAAGGVSACDCE